MKEKEFFAGVAQISALLAVLTLLVAFSILIYTLFPGQKKTDWLYRVVAGPSVRRYVDERLREFDSDFGSPLWSEKARRLIIRRKARRRLCVIIIVTVAVFSVVAISTSSLLESDETVAGPLGEVGVGQLVLVYVAYAFALMAPTVWDDWYHSDENLVLACFYLLKYRDSVLDEPGIERHGAALRQLRLVGRYLDQFELQVVRQAHFNKDNLFKNGIASLRCLIGDASDSVVSGAFSRRALVGTVAYHCSAVASSATVSCGVIAIPGRPLSANHAQLPLSSSHAQLRMAAFPVSLAVASVALVGVAVYILFDFEDLSLFTRTVAVLAALAPVLVQVVRFFFSKKDR